MQNEKLEHDRETEWVTIFAGVNSLFLEEVNDPEIKVSPSKEKRYIEAFQEGLETQDVNKKKDKLLEIRKLFNKKSELDHFLYLAGINKEPPLKPSNRIRQQFFA